MKRFLYTAILVFFYTAAAAQGSADYGKGLRVNIDPEGSKYVRFIFWNQFWGSMTENNPSTLVNGDRSEYTMSFGARRMRMLAMTQISPRYMIVMHLGINNQSFGSGGGSGTSGTGAYGTGKKAQLFFHDVYNEYAIVPCTNAETGEKNNFNLYAGAGLHFWNGLSRLTSGGTLNMLMIDAPVFNWPTVDMSDQFGRQFGIYAKGGYKKLHYQFHLNKPFVTNLLPVQGAGVAVDNNGDPHPSVGGYVEYQFLEEESQVLSYRTGTYLGTKKVLNFGAGFYHNRHGTRSSPALAEIRRHNINLFSADVFADLPFGSADKGMSVTMYSAYYDFDFGPNYIRTAGILNPGVPDPEAPQSKKVFEGAGNSRVLLGTGKIFYSQAGVLLPKFKGSRLRIQPMASVALKNLDYLNEGGAYWDAGTNFFLDGHHAKFTLQYSSRPLYHLTDKTLTDRKGELILQVQVYL